MKGGENMLELSQKQKDSIVRNLSALQEDYEHEHCVAVIYSYFDLAKSGYLYCLLKFFEGKTEDLPIAYAFIHGLTLKFIGVDEAAASINSLMKAIPKMSVHWQALQFDLFMRNLDEEYEDKQRKKGPLDPNVDPFFQ
jgi:hypothetical protein